MNRPTLVEELEQIAENLEVAASKERTNEYTDLEAGRRMKRAASDIRVALDNAESSLLLDLSENDLDRLREGETVDIVLEEDGDRTDKLQIQWKTVIESEGAAAFHEEITEAFSVDGDTGE